MRPSSLVLCLVAGAAACSPEHEPPPAAAPPSAVATPRSALPTFGLGIEALQLRPAGSALAVAGEEHALVRVRSSAPSWLLRSTAPVRFPVSLTARDVLAVDAAYRRWCTGHTIAGDEVLLAAAGGMRLPAPLACERSAGAPASGPRPLLPAIPRPGRRRSGARWPRRCLDSAGIGLLVRSGRGTHDLIVTRFQNVVSRSKRLESPPGSFSGRVPTANFVVPRTGVFDLIGRVLVTAVVLTATLAVAPGLAADLPSGTRFLSRGAQGWFWYERMAPEPVPPAEPVVGAAPTSPAAATLEPAMETTATAPGPLPLSAAWFRAELERYRDLAIDDPTPDKVRAYLYLQKVMLDKADSFARVSGEVAASDPYLDATTERPLAPFASSAANAEATSRRSAVLEQLSTTTGILFVVERACPVCLRQADVLEALRRQYGFAILTVSLDGAAPPGLMLPVRPDAGQAARLGVVGTPALYLMRPPDVILPLAQGALDQDTLLTRIVAQAHHAGWVDDATYAATRPVRQPFPVPDPGSLEAEALADPVQLVATLRTTLGLSDAILAGAQP